MGVRLFLLLYSMVMRHLRLRFVSWRLEKRSNCQNVAKTNPKVNAEIKVLKLLPFLWEERVSGTTVRIADLDATDSFAIQALFRLVTELFWYT